MKGQKLPQKKDPQLGMTARDPLKASDVRAIQRARVAALTPSERLAWLERTFTELVTFCGSARRR